MDVSEIGTASWRHVGGQYLALTKPRIVMLAAFCALIGMLLALMLTLYFRARQARLQV